MFSDLKDGSENVDEPYDEPYIVSSPTDTTTTPKKKSMAGPILTGIGLAGAAGVGAKVYLDKKKQNESGEFDETVEEDSDDSIVADEWQDDSENNEEYEGNNLEYEDDTKDYEYPID